MNMNLLMRLYKNIVLPALGKALQLRTLRTLSERLSDTFLSDLSALSGTLILFAISLSSCVSHPELMNFNAENFPQNKVEDILNATELKIQPEDLLRITVHSFDPAAAAPYNTEQAGQQGGQMNMMQNPGSLELFMGYFVDQEGAIDFPSLGRIEVAGLTLEETKFKILGLLQPFLNDAVVNIRFLNFKVSVMGEVNLPGMIRMTNKRVTLLEAISMAGDITDYGNRKNILLLREQNGKREYARLNLQSPELFSSPYFYLQQNDVIYIEPLQIKTALIADPAQRFISYGSAALSIVTLIIALTR